MDTAAWRKPTVREVVGVVRIGSMRATMFGAIEPVAATVTAALWSGRYSRPSTLWASR